MNMTKTALMLGLAFTMNAATAETVTFKINQVNSDNGMILVQIFDSEENYKANKAITAQQTKAQIGTVTITFNNLEPGEYAIRYFHDENSDGELETNLFGMPTEGFGYSNNAKANFGPAKYADMKFTVDRKNTNNASTVIYMD